MSETISYRKLYHSVTLSPDPGVWFGHKLHALKVEPLLALFALNHVSVITFRESTYAVNMNESMFLPTFLSRLLCRGKGCKLFILKTLFKVSSHFICIKGHQMWFNPQGSTVCCSNTVDPTVCVSYLLLKRHHRYRQHPILDSWAIYLCNLLFQAWCQATCVYTVIQIHYTTTVAVIRCLVLVIAYSDVESSFTNSRP